GRRRATTRPSVTQPLLRLPNLSRRCELLHHAAARRTTRHRGRARSVGAPRRLAATAHRGWEKENEGSGEGTPCAGAAHQHARDEPPDSSHADRTGAGESVRQEATRDGGCAGPGAAPARGRRGAAGRAT